jgi:hypothetical protein
MNFNPEYYIVYIAISLIIAVVISFLYYRKTSLSFPHIILLAGLRTLAVFCIFILLLISFIPVSKNTEEKPLNIFLIDNSLSMTLDNRIMDLRKTGEIINLLSNSSSETAIYVFSGGSITEIDRNEIKDLNADSLKGSGTNLTNVLREISEKYSGRKISTVNIISDGIINEGGSPVNLAQQTGASYNYFLIGDTIQRNDLSVKGIYFNKSVYIESNSEILVEFNSYNYSKAIRLKLFENDDLLQQKEIKVNKDNFLYNQTFTVKSSTEGIKKFRIEIEREPDEITYKNNSEEFFMDFIGNKFKMLVISGNPSPDFSYLSETIKSINNIEAKFFTQKSTGVFYEGNLPPLDEFSVLLFDNFPNTATELNQLVMLNGELKKLNLPLIFISGSNTDYEKLKIFDEILPVTFISTSENETRSGIKYLNDIPGDFSRFFSFGNIINNLPEIYIPGVNFSLKPESRSIFYSSKASKPVLVISGEKGKSSAAFFGYDFYRWRLNASNSDSKSVLSRMLTGIVLNIGNKEGNKKITLNPVKQVFQPEESIKINGSIKLSELSGNETVKLRIYNNSFSKEIEINKLTDNMFSGDIKNPGYGEYFIEGILLQNGQVIGEDIKKISVKESDFEFKDTKADGTIFNTLAGSTGGDRITGQDMGKLKSAIQIKNEKDLIIQNKYDKIFLNSNLLILFTIILLISVEWFIRKRMNLP